MLNETPPSGPWTGYYLYGDGILKHRMRLHLTFTKDGSIEGEGIDDVAPFSISGRFDGARSEAAWTKKYLGMHTVEYRGIYGGRSICGDWSLQRITGGFWVWPQSRGDSEAAEEQSELEAPLEIGAIPGGGSGAR